MMKAGERIMEIHRRLCRITGMLSFMIVKKNISRSDLIMLREQVMVTEEELTKLIGAKHEQS